MGGSRGMKFAGRTGEVYEWRREEDSLLMAFCLCTTEIFPENCAVLFRKSKISFSVDMKHFPIVFSKDWDLHLKISYQNTSIKVEKKIIIVGYAQQKKKVSKYERAVQEYRANYILPIKCLMSNITLQIFHSSWWISAFCWLPFFYFCHVFNNVNCIFNMVEF